MNWNDIVVETILTDEVNSFRLNSIIQIPIIWK